jgi:hypothetical protein
MSSNHSAGPLLIDEVTQYMFFFDLNFASPYIGKAPLDLNGGSTDAVDYVSVFCCMDCLIWFLDSYSVCVYGCGFVIQKWLALTYYKVNGFTMDAHWKYRKVISLFASFFPCCHHCYHDI